MAQLRKMDCQSEAKCSADKLYDVFKNKIHLMPTISNHATKDVKVVVEGEGESSVRLWSFVAGGNDRGKQIALTCCNNKIYLKCLFIQNTKYHTKLHAAITWPTNQKIIKIYTRYKVLDVEMHHILKGAYRSARPALAIPTKRRWLPF